MTREEYEEMCRNDILEAVKNGDLEPKDEEQLEYMIQMSIESDNELNY